MVFLIVNIVLLLLVIILLLLLSAVWPPDSPWAPWWQMPIGVIGEMCKLAKITNKDTIYDLGCGTGWALITANKNFGAKGVGIEIDPLRFWIARFNLWRTHHTVIPAKAGIYKSGSPIKSGMTNSKNIVILRKNFFQVDISPASIIFVYLIPKTLKRLVPKFLKELKPGTKIISYVYDMPKELFKGKLQLLKFDKEKKIYLYQLIS